MRVSSSTLTFQSKNQKNGHKSSSSRSPGDVEVEPVAKKTKLVLKTIIYTQQLDNWILIQSIYTPIVKTIIYTHQSTHNKRWYVHKDIDFAHPTTSHSTRDVFTGSIYKSEIQINCHHYHIRPIVQTEL